MRIVDKHSSSLAVAGVVLGKDMGYLYILTILDVKRRPLGFKNAIFRDYVGNLNEITVFYSKSGV